MGNRAATIMRAISASRISTRITMYYMHTRTTLLSVTCYPVNNTPFIIIIIIIITSLAKALFNQSSPAPYIKANKMKPKNQKHMKLLLLSYCYKSDNAIENKHVLRWRQNVSWHWQLMSLMWSAMEFQAFRPTTENALLTKRVWLLSQWSRHELMISVDCRHITWTFQLGRTVDSGAVPWITHALPSRRTSRMCTVLMRDE